MEEQIELKKRIGTIESEGKRLEPKKVKIVKVEVVAVGEKKNKKVSCSVKHPDAENTISISSISYLRDKAIVTTGLWFNLDKEENVQKGSALAVFMQKNDANTISELEGKEISTELDGNYLCFKAY